MFTAGEKVQARKLSTITGAQVEVPEPDRLVHLQLRRFAGCPICNLHIREVARRNAEIESAGVTEVVVFHSAADRLRQYVDDVQFALVADPERALYKEFGVESSLRSVDELLALAADKPPT